MRWMSVLVMAAAPAAAQDITFDIGATEACVDTAASAWEAEDCIGLSANACMETPDGSTTVGMGYCLEQEWNWWDGRLNAAYSALMKQHKKDDADMAGMAGVPSLADSLKAMQRAWIPYRDAACDYERAQWGGGTGGGPATVGCLMLQTGRQALSLEGRLGG